MFTRALVFCLYSTKRSEWNKRRSCCMAKHLGWMRSWRLRAKNFCQSPDRKEMRSWSWNANWRTKKMRHVSHFHLLQNLPWSRRTLSGAGLIVLLLSTMLSCVFKTPFLFVISSWTDCKTKAAVWGLQMSVCRNRMRTWSTRWKKYVYFIPNFLRESRFTFNCDVECESSLRLTLIFTLF